MNPPDTSPPGAQPSVNPAPLLSRAGQPVTSGERRGTGVATRLAKSAIERLLNRMTVGSLTVVDRTDGAESVYGPGPSTGDSAYTATLIINDGRAWSSVVQEGSIGFGRGYIEGWWTSVDPTAVVRVVIANLQPIDDLRNRIGRYTLPVSDRVRRVLPQRGRAENRAEISSHYDLGNSFFEQFLDETMTYSSAVFPDPDADLTEASRHKYDLVIDGLDLGPEHHLLEIGTGWGGLALQAAKRTGCRVTTTTISSEQLRTARQRVTDAGLTDRVEVIDADWRDLTGRFDRIASIEMIEAVDWRDYQRFFATIERCLRPDGRALLQAICVPDRRYGRTKNTEDYIRRFVFPGGYLPSIGAIVEAVARATRLQVHGFNDFSGHYAETLRSWRRRFDRNESEIRSLGLDDRFIRLWRFYLAYCEAGFLERHCTVNHIALVGPQWRGGIERVPAAL